MSTGRIDYSPDYKSDKKRVYPDPRKAFAQIERRAELQQLKDAVVEAARACRTQPGSSWGWLQPSGAYGPEVCNAWAQLKTSIDALLEFEAKQDQIKN